MTTYNPIIEHPGPGADQLSDLSLDATTVSSHDLKFFIQDLVNHLTVYTNWNSETQSHAMQVISNKIINLREDETDTIQQQKPSTLSVPESGFAFDASDAEAFDFNFKTASPLDATEIDAWETPSRCSQKKRQTTRPSSIIRTVRAQRSLPTTTNPGRPKR